MLDTSYSSPHPNFERSKVKGLVTSLITLDPSDYPKSTVLEISARAKSYNDVVEDEKIGKDVLQHGELKKRVTIIPLNKIKMFEMSTQAGLFESFLRNVFIPNIRALSQKLRSATRLAPGKVRLALSLVGYSEEVSSAMSYVFSDTLICDDAASAKPATFSKEVGVKWLRCRSFRRRDDVFMRGKSGSGEWRRI